MESSSIFDTLEGRKNPSFWYKDIIDITEKSKKLQIIFEDVILRKSLRSNELIPRKYIFFEDVLIKMPEQFDTPLQQTLKWIQLEIIHIEEITLVNLKSSYPGFRLIQNRKVEEIYARNKEQFQVWQKILRQNCFFKDFAWQFKSLKLIGEGGFAKALKNSDMIEYAVKSIPIKSLEKRAESKKILLNEINILRNLQHSGIIKLNEIYETDTHVYLVQELMRGGHILEKISKRGFYTEQDASLLMEKLLSALDYLHSKQIVHRDIKLDNLILIDKNNDIDIKIIDFGLACKLDSDLYSRRCGTPGYTAPEILNKKQYDTKADIFSAGVVLYIMLVGYLPFDPTTCSGLITKNQQCEIDYSFPDDKIRPSNTAIDLLKKLLQKNPQKRLSAKEALQHPWIASKAADAPLRELQSLKSAQDNMKKFLDMDRFNVSKIKPNGGFQVSPRTDIKQTLMATIHEKKKDEMQRQKTIEEQIDDEAFENFDTEANIFSEEPQIHEVIAQLNREAYMRKPSKDTFLSGLSSFVNSASSSQFTSPNFNNLNYMNSPSSLLQKIESIQNNKIKNSPELCSFKDGDNFRAKLIQTNLKQFDEQKKI